MEVKILGTGCANCKNLEIAVIHTLSDLNITADVQKVEDIQKIMSYGIMRTPGLVINDKVVLSGKLPSMDELRSIFIKYTE